MGGLLVGWLVGWLVGMLVCWCVGLLVCWCVGVLVCKSCTDCKNDGFWFAATTRPCGLALAKLLASCTQGPLSDHTPLRASTCEASRELHPGTPQRPHALAG